MKRTTCTPDQALERACRADLDQMPLPIVIAYVVSRGYSVTPDAGDVPFDLHTVLPSRCQCYLCRERWNAVLEVGCE